jgi:hypothetical protein
MHQISGLRDEHNSTASVSSGHTVAELDLNGAPLVDPLPPSSNVLLVILEGVSGSYLPSIRSHHGVTHRISMPELEAIAGRGLAWSTFVVHQRQTNRGEYALLCGDYPKLLTSEPRMTELAGLPRLLCLPAILGEQGFATVYQQAAPMAFMSKDQFMPTSGFAQSFGDTSFGRAYNRNQWGIDDRAFFEQSVEKVKELRQGSKPWFLTLLNVGTHHPFNAPPDFEGSHAPGSAGWAMEYLDLAVGDFVRRLESLGVLDDTLVIIVNDESRDIVAGASDIENSLRQAWGVLIVLHPSGVTGVIHEPAMQLDLPVSILDALGLSDRCIGLGGRSIFRSYDTSRQLLWGNTHLRLVGGLSETGQLGVCAESLAPCVAADFLTTLFSPNLKFSPIEPENLQWLIRGAEASLGTYTAERPRQEFLLIEPVSIPVMTAVDEQFIFGGQFLTIPARVRSDVEIEVDLVGDSGSLEFHHDLIVGRSQAYHRRGALNVGETLKIRYSVFTEIPLDAVESRFWIEKIQGRALALDFSVASVRMEPTTGGAVEPGILEHLFVVE